MKRRVLLIVVVLLMPSVALADPASSDAAAAQVLFYDARDLMAKGRYGEACPRLEESLRLDRGLGTQFNLADCNEHLGKLATAWAGFLDVAAKAKATNQPDRERVARARATALEPRLPKLIVEVRGAEAVEVSRDGIILEPASWGAAIPVDPGPHHVTVTAKGKEWQSTTSATEGNTARVIVPAELPAIATATPDPTPDVTSGAVTTTSSEAAGAPEPLVPEVSEPATSAPGATQRALGWALAGVGVVSAGIGAAFGVVSMGKRNESRSHCVLDVCDQEGVTLRDDAIKNGNVATATIVAGAAAFAGGLVLVLTAPKRSGGTVSSLRAGPAVALGRAGLLIQGTFQ